jgi:5-methyltetrahydrofolate--homocysteine methyltransferase
LARIFPAPEVRRRDLSPSGTHGNLSAQADLQLGGTIPQCYSSKQMPTKTILEKVLGDGPVLTDGGWGTELQKMGLAPGEFADTWNLTQPQKVAAVARSYVEAGSRIVLTNTFRSNRIAFDRHDDRSKLREINRAGVEISRSAAGQRALVFASMGPSGKMLAAEEISEQELADAFGEQARALSAAGPDGLVIETMSDLNEAVLALRAAKETGLPVVVCMVFDSGKDQDRTLTGVRPEQAAEKLTSSGADVVGANCGKGIEKFLPICRRLRAACDKPIWIKPNAGLPRVHGDSIVYDTTPEVFASYLPSWVAGGASFVGGCCGTDPGFIRALSQTLRNSGYQFV